MTATITPAGRHELMERIKALTPDEREYALYWLAASGPDSPDGKVLRRALREVEDRRALAARAQTVTTGGQL